MNYAIYFILCSYFMNCYCMEELISSYEKQIKIMKQVDSFKKKSRDAKSLQHPIIPNQLYKVIAEDFYTTFKDQFKTDEKRLNLSLHYASNMEKLCSSETTKEPTCKISSTKKESDPIEQKMRDTFAEHASYLFVLTLCVGINYSIKGMELPATLKLKEINADKWNKKVDKKYTLDKWKAIKTGVILKFTEAISDHKN